MPAWCHTAVPITSSTERARGAHGRYATRLPTASGGVTEDQIETAEKEIQKLTDQYIAKLDGHLAHKEKEIMTV